MLWCTFIPEFWHYPVRKNIRLFKYLVCMGRMRMCSLITHYAVFLPYSNCLLQCETAIWDKSIPHHLNITISTSNDVVIYINTSNIEMCGNMNENINLKLYIQKKKEKKKEIQCLSICQFMLNEEVILFNARMIQIYSILLRLPHPTWIIFMGDFYISILICLICCTCR